MLENEWKEYKRMIVPIEEPHTKIVLNKNNIKELWKKYPSALCIRYTENWDVQNSSGWYYLIYDGIPNIHNFDRNIRKQIRKGLKRFELKKINLEETYDEIYEVYLKASERYSKYVVKTKKEYREYIDIQYQKEIDIWGAFSTESNKMLGYSICMKYEDCVDWNESSYVKSAFKDRISDAMTFYLMDYYIREKKYKYIVSGQRCINHETNVQDYEKKFGFREAYCKLVIIYRPLVGVLICALYPFRKVIGYIGKKNSFFHNLNSILFMEEIKRKQKGEVF